MQKHRQIEIDENDPFKNDLLDRKDEISNLTSIVLNFNDPLVLALNAPWGAGKTTFVKLWRAYLKLEGKQSIYFNAWETDFADDPLIVLVSVLDKWLKATQDPSKFEKWRTGIKNVLPGIAKRTAVAAVKVATLNGIDLSTELERIVAESTGNIASDLLENFDKQSKSVDQFRQIIAQALDELPADQKNLVIFIDELDRCRPTYAIELLERIKHLFNIQRLVFVLSTDTGQLAHSIRAVYGNGFDGKKYLQRFIELDYALKKPDSKEYIEALFKSLGLNETLSARTVKDDIGRVKNCFSVLAIRFDLRPRDLNRLLMRIRLILYSVPDNNYLDAPLLVSLLLLREQKKELYDQYVITPNIADKVIEYLFPNFLTATDDSSLISAICSMIGCLIASNMKNNQEFERLIKSYDKNPKEKSDTISEMIVSWAKEPRNSIDSWSFSHKLTVERIELVHQIKIEV
jgi:KAP family P-loop domain